MKIELSSLSELQAAKWFFLHERQRHIKDIEEIDKDLTKLRGVALPEELMKVLDCRFEVPVPEMVHNTTATYQYKEDKNCTWTG